MEENRFIRYLEAKRSVDDRALNRVVWQALSDELARDARRIPAIVEVGCGIGTMLERIVRWRLAPRGRYTGVDADADCIEYARRTLPDRLREIGAAVQTTDEVLSIRGSGVELTAELAVADLYDFSARAGGQLWDLLLAHAVVDLLDIPRALPALFSLLPPGGLWAFTIAFDGATLFEPTVSAELDERIERLYHRTMDQRVTDGRPSGDSRSGRHLFAHLARAGARVIAAGGSDWVVHSVNGAYPSDEAYFLRHIVRTVKGALAGSTEIGREELQSWAARREEQIDRGELVYIAHQLDLAGRRP